MPRVTRKSLADTDSPSRSSPRASTKASTAAAGTSSPAKTRGRRTGAKEETESSPPQEVMESKGRGRSTSRSKSRTSASPSPAPTSRQSRSRGRSAVTEEKKKPTPARRGRAKKEPEEEEEEEEEELEEEEEEEEEEEAKVTPRRGRAQSKGKAQAAAAKKRAPPPAKKQAPPPAKKQAPPPAKKQAPPPAEKETPPPAASRGSRRSATGATAEEPKKATPRSAGKAKAKPAPAAKPASRSRRSRGGGDEPPEEKEEVEEEGNAAMEEEEEMDTGAEDKGAAEKESVEKESVGVEGEKEKEQLVSDKEEKAPATEKAAVSSPQKETPAATVSASPVKENSVPAAKPARAPAPAVETMEEGVVKEETKNGDLAQSPPKGGAKRKLDESVEEEVVPEAAQPEAKRARINGTEQADQASAAAAKVEESKVKDSTSEGEVLKDFVVVSKDDVPAADSVEVKASLPPPHEVKAAAPTEEKMEADAVGVMAAPVTVVPLTEAEMAKAYATQVQGVGEMDDVSSTIVEVGSVAGSDVTGCLSRGLDASELQSASNSVDGDDTADTSITDGDFASPAPIPQASDPVAPVADPTPTPVPAPAHVSESQSIAPAAVVTNSNKAANNGDSSTAVSTAANPQVIAGAQEVNSTVNSAPSSSQAEPSASSGPAADKDPAAGPMTERVWPIKGSSVSDRLGSHDPTFLAKYSSKSIFDRAYVPNPALPPDFSPAPGTSFSVVSYNILAECNRVKADYSYTAEEYLSQDYRHGLMMKELAFLDGDIVCMQEVGPEYFTSKLLPAMRSCGYDGLMKCRTKEAYNEGEATFYKTSLFELEASKGVSLTEVAHKEVELGGLKPEVGAAINNYLDRADVVLITRLRCKGSGKVVTIGNVHIVWDFLKSPDVRCIQAACAIKEVVGMAGGEGAHMICGDFNSEWSTPVYQLVLDGYLSDFSIHSLQAVTNLQLTDPTLSKSLVNHLWRAFQHTSSNLKSAYSAVTSCEPELTTWTGFMQSTVDYLFYTTSSLQPLGVLKTIDRPVLQAAAGLPTKDFPSDHLSMKAVMAFK